MKKPLTSIITGSFAGILTGVYFSKKNKNTKDTKNNNSVSYKNVSKQSEDLHFFI